MTAAEIARLRAQLAANRDLHREPERRRTLADMAEANPALHARLADCPEAPAQAHLPDPAPPLHEPQEETMPDPTPAPTTATSEAAG